MFVYFEKLENPAISVVSSRVVQSAIERRKLKEITSSSMENVLATQAFANPENISKKNFLGLRKLEYPKSLPLTYQAASHLIYI